MIKQILSVILLLFVLNPVISQCTLYKLDLSQKIAQSILIVEGRVVQQTTFMPNAPNDRRIFTVNVIELYKVLKGTISTNKIVLITEGGRMGEFMYQVTPSLNLQKGEVGMFFCESTPVIAPKDITHHAQYRIYGSTQGFIRYDEFRGYAADPFETYRDIQSQLYRPTLANSGGALLELSAYTLSPKSMSLSRMAPVIDSVKIHADSAAVGNLGALTVFAGTGLYDEIDMAINSNVHSTLIISGSNFEARGANSKVFFRKADDGGNTFVECPDNEILTWTDTLIEVLVPTEAGSGNFRVQNNSTNITESTMDLVVPFSHSNISGASTMDQIRRGIDLQDANGGGGYALSLSSSTANNGVSFLGSAAQGIFENAVDTWCGGSGFNTMVGGSTTADTAGNDNLNTIMFDNDNDPLPAGVLARTTTISNSCDGGNVWYLLEFDIRFRRDGTDGVTWNFTNAATDVCCYDFQSVALHELGHAHLLSHVINPGGIMHHAIANGENIRTLGTLTDMAGGEYIIAKSEFLNTCDGAVVGMLPCSVLPIEFISFEGTPKKMYNYLNWTATATFDHSEFALERSNDGISFEKIGTIPIEKHGSRPQLYSFEDRNLSQETHFYRLNSISLDGSIQQSNIVELTNPFDQLQMSVYPNPASDQINIRFQQNKHKNETVFLQLIDMRGKSIYSETFHLSQNNHELSVGALSAGVYIVRLSIPAANVQKIVRLVKR